MVGVGAAVAPDVARDPARRSEGAIEESLRLEPTAALIDRYAIRERELVTISLAGANRDPAVFPQAQLRSIAQIAAEARPNRERSRPVWLHRAKVDRAVLDRLADAPGRRSSSASLRSRPGQRVPRTYARGQSSRRSRRSP